MTRPAERELLVKTYAAFNARDVDATLAAMHPDGFATDERGRIVVDVHQVVRDRGGAVLADRMVQHVYVIEDGLIRSMEIKE